MDTASKKLKNVGSSMSNVGAKMSMGISAPLALIGVKAAQASMEFETSFAHIRGLVGASEQTITSFKDAIGKIGPVVGKTGSELAKASFFITSAGLKGERAAAGIEALEASAMGAAAGLGDTAVVADAATSAMNAYGEANLSAKQAVATLVATVREGKAEAASIAPVLGRLLPIAAELEVSFDQVGGALAAMTRLGFDAATSATSIRATMVQILKPSIQAKKALAEYNLTFDDLRATLKEKGLIGLLTSLKDTFGENETAMAKVFPNVRALAGVLALVGKNTAETEKVFASMANTTENDLLKAFEAVEQTARQKMNRAMAEMSGAMRQLGDAILPVLVPMVQQLGKGIAAAAEAFGNLHPWVKSVAVGAAALLTVMGPLMMLMGAAVSTIGSLFGAISAATTATLAHTAAVKANNLALSANIKRTKIVAGQNMAMKAGLVGLTATLAYMAGTVMRPYLNKWLGINKAMDLVANKNKDLVKGMAESETAFRSQHDAYTKLRGTLKLTGEEWQVQAEWTEENAKKLSRLTERAIEYARNNRTKLVPATDEAEAAAKRHADRMVKVKDRIMAAKVANDKFIASVKEKYELQSKEDILANLKLIVKEYEAMVKAGYSQGQLQDAFGEKLVDLTALAKENGIELEAGVLKMAGALQDKADPALKKSLGLIANELPKHINAMPGKVIPGMVMVGKQIATSLVGGMEDEFKHGAFKSDFVKAALAGQVEGGIQEGITLGEELFAGLRTRQEGEVLTVRVQGDWSEFDDQARYRSAGYTPPTGEAGAP